VAIAEDTTNSPARVVSSGATTDTAAFTPPANCILVCFMHSDSNTGAADETLTASDSLAGTWSTALLDNARGGAAVAISWRAIGASPASMTTSVTSNKGSVAKSNFTRIFTGTDLVAPFGASAAGNTAAISVVSTVANSWVWSAHLGSNVAQTAGASTTQKTQFGGFDSGDAIGVYASTNTTAGSGTTITLTEVGGTTVHHLAVEILPPSSGGATLNGAWAPAAAATLAAAGGVTELGAATFAASAQLTTAAVVSKFGALALAAGASLTTASVVTKLGAWSPAAGAALAVTGTAVAVAAWAPAAGAAFSLAGVRSAVAAWAPAAGASFTLAASGTQAAAWAPSAGASLVAAGSSGLTPLVRAVLVPGGTIGSTLVPGGAAGSSLISGGAAGSTLIPGGV
jgi:filamentous hemagglutinin